MSYFTDFVRGFLDLGATVILPVVIFLLGLFFRQKIGAAFRSGLTIGVAFVGIFLVIDLLVKNLGPAAQAMVKNLGVSLNVIDVGCQQHHLSLGHHLSQHLLFHSES